MTNYPKIGIRDLPAAQQAMGRGYDTHDIPIAENVIKYDKLYNDYRELDHR